MLGSISRILKIISKEDALLIFSMAKNGIEADISAHNKIGLTRKQYYTRLAQLKNAGVIEKKEASYFQTTLGSFLYENCIGMVLHAIRNSKQMAMIDVLRRSDNFPENIESIKNAVCKIVK